MEVRQRGLITGILTAVLLVAPFAAEAKRAGGGKSHGMQRSAQPTQSYQQPRQAAPAQQAPVAGAATQQKSGPGVGGMVAAGVADAAIGAVAANALADDQSVAASEAQAAQAEEEKGGIPGWIWILLAAAVAFFIFRKMGAKKKVASNPFAPNSGAATAAPFVPIFLVRMWVVKRQATMLRSVLLRQITRLLVQLIPKVAASYRMVLNLQHSCV